MNKVKLGTYVNDSIHFLSDFENNNLKWCRKWCEDTVNTYKNELMVVVINETEIYFTEALLNAISCE